MTFDSDPRFDDIDNDLRDLAGEMTAMLERRAADVDGAPRRLPAPLGDPPTPQVISLQDHDEPQAAGRPNSRPFLAAAAVALIGAMGIVALLFPGGDTSVIAPASTPEPQVTPVPPTVEVDVAPAVEDQIERLQADEDRLEEFVEEHLIDSLVNQAAQSALDTLPPSLVGAIATVNNRTGELVSSIATFPEGVDVARPVGSTQHLYTLTAAFEDGIQAHDWVSGVGPCTIGDAQEPLENFVRSTGAVDLVINQTLRASRCAFARLEHVLVGAPKIAATMSELVGRDVAPSTFWTHETRLTPQEQARALATLVDAAANGDAAAESVLAVYQNNVQMGTANRARIGPGVVGVTGTDEDFMFAWFVGSRGDFTSAVLIVSANGEPMNPGQDGFDISVTGGSLPAEVWRALHDQIADLGIAGAEPADDRVGWAAVNDRESILLDPGEAVGMISPGCVPSHPAGLDEDGDRVTDRCYQSDPDR